MNKAGKSISRGITGRYFINIEVGKRWFKLYQPTIDRMCKIIEAWGDIEFSEGELKDIVKNKNPSINGLAYALGCNWFTRMYYRYKLGKCTSSQLKVNTEILYIILGAKDFFQAASLMKSVTLIAATPK